MTSLPRSSVVSARIALTVGFYLTAAVTTAVDIYSFLHQHGIGSIMQALIGQDSADDNDDDEWQAGGFGGAQVSSAYTSCWHMRPVPRTVWPGAAPTAARARDCVHAHSPLYAALILARNATTTHSYVLLVLPLSHA